MFFVNVRIQKMDGDSTFTLYVNLTKLIQFNFFSVGTSHALWWFTESRKCTGTHPVFIVMERMYRFGRYGSVTELFTRNCHEKYRRNGACKFVYSFNYVSWVYLLRYRLMISIIGNGFYSSYLFSHFVIPKTHQNWC